METAISCRKGDQIDGWPYPVISRIAACKQSWDGGRVASCFFNCKPAQPETCSRHAYLSNSSLPKNFSPFKFLLFVECELN